MAENTNSSTEENIDGIVPDEVNDESQLAEEDKNINATDNEDEITEESNSEENSENEDSDAAGQVESKEDNKKFSVQKKQTLIHKILYIVIGLLFLIILIGVVLYFIGFFDEEKPMPKKPMDMNTTKEMVVTKIEKPKYKFKSDDINLKRINSKLALLTKYEILESAEIERQKKKELEEKEKEFNERNIKYTRDENNITAIIDENNLSKLEMPLEQKGMDINSSSKIAMKSDMNSSMSENNMSEQNITISNTGMKMDNQDKIKDIINTDENGAKKFLKFIQVATLKYKLYKSFLNKIKDVDARISICKNEDNKTLILIGPFKESESRKFIVEQINKNIVPDAFAIGLTNEEFEKRCSF